MRKQKLSVIQFLLDTLGRFGYSEKMHIPTFLLLSFLISIQ